MSEKPSDERAESAGPVVTNETLRHDYDALVTEHRLLAQDLAFFREFTDSASVGMLWLLADGTILWANQWQLTLAGYSAEEYIGRHLREFQTEEPALEDLLRGVGNGEPVRQCELRLRRKDGSMRRVRIDTTVLSDNGTYLHTRCFVVDITDSKESQERDAYLAAIVSSSDDAIVSKTLTGIVTSWNRGAERLFGYTAEEMIGQSILRIIPQERQKEEEMILSSIRRGQRIDHFDTVRRRKDGSQVEISVTVSPVVDKAGTIIGASKVARDISKQKEAERAIQEREEQFRTLADSIPQLAWMADAQGYIFWYNRGWYAYSGTTVDEMKGWGWQAVHDPAVLPRVLERWKNSIATGQAFEMEFPLRAANGDYRMFLTRVNPIRNSAGQIMRWFGTNTDIEDLKRAREALAESVSTLETLNQLGQAISAELNLEKLVQTITDAATQLSGAEFGALFYNVTNEKGDSYTLYALSGASREAFANFPLPRKTEIFAPTFDGTSVVRSDDITRDVRYGKNSPHLGMPDGHLPVRSYLAVPVISRSQEVLGGLFFGHSKTGVFTSKEEDLVRGLASQAAIAIDNARLFEKSLEATRTRERFLSIASHELKTPLTSLKLQTQIRKRALEKGNLERFSGENISQLLAEDEKQLNRILRLVDDILDISKIQAGKLSLHLEQFDLYALVGELVDRFSDMITSAGCTITVLGDPATGLWDRYRIEQVVTNLLTNAIKYGAGSPIVIEVRSHLNLAWLSIQDHGIGIAAEDHQRIFGQFERATAHSDVGGLGLGLYIVHQLLESHGGRITVTSELGKGATFTVELPLKPEMPLEGKVH